MSAPRTRRVPVALDIEEYEALERRAKRNDRFAWQEAGRIVRDALIETGDLPKPQEPGVPS